MISFTTQTFFKNHVDIKNGKNKLLSTFDKKRREGDEKIH